MTEDVSTSAAPAGAPDRGSDVWWAAGAGLVALIVYIRTLAPGLTDDVDTAMFQFIGRVLGVAHNPGYPLYVLLTHGFSWVPIGSLAYRINLFSALLGSLTLSLAYLIARRLGCRRVIAAAAALALGFGRVFWSQAVIAEVYTLNSAIVAGVLLSLLVWSDTHRARWYFVAVALFAAGLGNHTTIVGFAPGIALFVLLVDRRFALRLSTIGWTAALIATGLLQYLFVLVRSAQPDAYVESRATTLAALGRVMLGGQFKDRLFAFGLRALVTDRIPTFITTIFAPDLAVIGLVLSLLGFGWLLRRRPSVAVLLASGAGAIVAFALNYSVIDTPVFLIPALLVAWVFAAVGAEQVMRRLPDRLSEVRAAAVLWLLIPGWLVASNFDVSDRSRDVSASVELDRLFEALPGRAAIVQEDFLADRMVMAKLLGADGSRRSGIEPAPLDANALRAKTASGLPVFAFSKSAERLRFEGLDVGFQPLRLIEGPLEKFLARLTDGTTVAMAVPAVHAGAFAGAAGTALSWIGGSADLTSLADGNIAVVGVRGHGGAAVATGRLEAAIDLARAGSIGASGMRGPAEIHVRGEPFEAVIRQGDREVVRTSEGVALAVWTAQGKLESTYVLDAANRFQVPIPIGAFSAYPLRGASHALRIAEDAWTDVARAFDTGSVLLRVDAGQELVLYLGDDTPMAPRVVGASDQARVDIASGRTASEAAGHGELDANRAALVDHDGLVYRVRIDAFGPAVAVELALGGIPRHAFARITRAAGARGAAACPVDIRGLLRSPDHRSEVLQMGRDAQARLTGEGWSPVDWDDAGPFRWLTATQGRVVLPLAGRTPRRLQLQVLRDPRSLASSIRIRLNGADLPAQPLQDGWHVYDWVLSPGQAAAGTNEVSVLVDRVADAPAGRAGGKGIAVSDVRVIHDES